MGRGGDHFRCRRLAPAHPAAVVACRVRRRTPLFRAAHQGALHRGCGGPLDAGRAHRRQLHQHPHRQAVRPHRARGHLCAFGARGADGQVAGLAPPRHDHGLRTLLPERPAHGDGNRDSHLALERRQGHGRRHRGRHRPGAAHHRHVGLDPLGRRQHLRERRCRAGGHGDDQPLYPSRRSARQQAADRQPRATSASTTSASTTASGWSQSRARAPRAGAG